MNLSLTAKLLLSFVVVGLTGTAVLATLAATATADEFDQFVFSVQRQSLAEELAGYYDEHGSWEGVPRTEFRRPFGLPRGPGRGGPQMAPFVLADPSGAVLVPGPGYRLGETVSAAALSEATVIEVQDEVVGNLLMQPGAFGQDPAEAAFLDRVNLWLRLGAIGSTVAAVIVGALLARSVTRPLGELRVAAQEVAKGDLETAVPVRSSDELGQLALAFNQMNANLAGARDLRRQMTADIAHELRTPLSLILGHAEGIRDGVLEPDDHTLAVIQDEAARLERIVEDLRLLSLADAGELPLEPRPTDPAALLRTAASTFQALASDKGLVLHVEAPESLPDVTLDVDRMLQVLRNLLSNALRHTPPGGRITLHGTASDDRLQLQVADSGPGIAQGELPYVFDRFYRADKARQRDGGGSGLGLAIARSLTQAQGGRLRATSPPGQGAVFTIELPVSPRSTTQDSS